MTIQPSYGDVLATMNGSDGQRTKALYDRLEQIGPAGRIALNVFRAVKTSMRAKVYRRGPGHITAAYDRKSWSMGNACTLLASHYADLGIRWGWGIDTKAEQRGDPNSHVLYIDLPTGQVSFHAPRRGQGPTYDPGWDGIEGQAVNRIVRYVSDLLDNGHPKIIPGRPMSEAPRDGTVILAEQMNYYGVPETGGYSFERIVASDHDGWKPEREPISNVTRLYGKDSFLRWWPESTDPSLLILTPRTNWRFVPSNGTQGMAYYESWCSRCIRERPMRIDHDRAIAMNLGCKIFSNTLAHRIGDPEYPIEWTYWPNMEPKCTAFDLDTGHPSQQPRCARTPDLFETTGKP